MVHDRCPWCGDFKVGMGGDKKGQAAWFAIGWVDTCRVVQIKHCPFCGFLFRIHCADCGFEVQRLRGGLACGHIHGYQEPI
jgi:hypothetical protein